MRNKARFQYVDQLRKINTIQKVGPIQSYYPQDFQQNKQENAKFIRYKQVPTLDEAQNYQSAFLFTNPLINQYKKDIQINCKDGFSDKNQELTQDIDYYHNWSQQLNKQIKTRNYQHKFFFKKAQPPPRNKDQKQRNKKQEEHPKNSNGPQSKQQQNNQEDTSIDLPQRGKYNFNQITKHLYSYNFNKDDQQGNYHQDLAIKNQIASYRDLKGLRDIQKIGDFTQEFNKFNYFIEDRSELYPIEFVDNSVVITDKIIKIDQFRDIGSPSRQLMNFTIKNHQKMKRKDDQDHPDFQSVYNQQKRQLLYLYFLKDDQLKINKMSLSFADLVNISMGRITPINAHMCIRSEKVTKAQYQKLLKKMQRYDIRQDESSKPKVDKQTFTDQIELLIQDNTHNNKVQDRHQEQELPLLNLESIIQEINRIKKEVKKIQNSESNNVFHAPNFNHQIYTKLQKLLNLLYDYVIEKGAVKYPLNQIMNHLEEIKGKHDKGYQRMRILYYIVNTYEQCYNKKRKKPDLRDMALQKGIGTPTATRYKGKLPIGQEQIQTKKVYGFNNPPQTNRKKQPQNARSKSPRPTTPLKTTRNQPFQPKTPTKKPQNNITATKKVRLSTTPNKSFTARK